MFIRGLQSFRRSFSTMFDPYYILGVDRTSEFTQIKKAYYKMASQYHPDKNDTPEANKKFVLIKQAFEAIKMQKGLMKPQNFYPSDEKSSMRPNPSRFYTEQQQQGYSDTDFNVERQKAQAKGQEYQRFNTSFKTIYDMKQIKIKVQKGQMKDATERFGLEKYKVKIKNLSNNSLTYLVYIGVGLVFFFMTVNLYYSAHNKVEKEMALVKMSKIVKRKTVDTETEQLHKAQIQVIQNNQDIQKMQIEEINRKIMKGQSVFVKEKVIDLDQLQKV